MFGGEKVLEYEQKSVAPIGAPRDVGSPNTLETIAVRRFQRWRNSALASQQRIA